MKHAWRLVPALLISSTALPAAAQDVRLTFDSGVSQTSYAQSCNQNTIAVDRDRINIVWADSRDGQPYQNLNIYTKRSDDGGATWGPDTPLTFHTGNDFAMDPMIVAQGETLHVVWADGNLIRSDMYYRRSRDGGASWEPTRRLSGFNTYSANPILAAAGANLHVVFESQHGALTGARELYYVRSFDGGESWDTPVRFTHDPEDSQMPTLAVFGKTLHLVWSSATSDFASSFLDYSRSEDGGDTWTDPERIVAHPSLSYGAFLALGPGTDGRPGRTLHLAWMDNRQNWLIYYKRSKDGGRTWEIDRQLSEIPWDYFPFLVVDGRTVHLAYYSLTGNYELHYLKSLDGGKTFRSDELLLSQYPPAYFPSMALQGSRLHMIWTDNRDGDSINTEVYYRAFDSPGGGKLR